MARPSRACDRFRGSRTSGTEGRGPALDNAIAIECGGDLESLTFRGTD